MRQNAPITILSIGGRYCSIMHVDGGKAFVFERIMARTATAVARVTGILLLMQLNQLTTHRQCQLCHESFARRTPTPSRAKHQYIRNGNLYSLRAHTLASRILPVNFLQSDPSAAIKGSMTSGPKTSGKDQHFASEADISSLERIFADIFTL